MRRRRAQRSTQHRGATPASPATSRFPPGCRGSWPTETGKLFAELGRRRLRRRQLRARRLRRRMGRGAALLHRRAPRAPTARATPPAVHERGLAKLRRAHRGARAQHRDSSSIAVVFEAVPDSFMMEIAVYGLPVRMPHWSFGVRYIYQLIQRHMGHSRLFEVVFPGNPGHAYLAESNGLAENILVTAHVLGHADFSRNNLLFRRCQEQVSEHIVEHAAHPRAPDQPGDRGPRLAARRGGARCRARPRAVRRHRPVAAARALLRVPRGAQGAGR